MVLKTNSYPFTKRGGSGSFGIPAPRTRTPRVLNSRTLSPSPYVSRGTAPQPQALKAPLLRRTTGQISPDFFIVSGGAASETEDVIDLGAPRHVYPAPMNRIGHAQGPHKRCPYTPNPRLYPGPAAGRAKRERSSVEGARRQKRFFKRPVPNSRLYRPVPRPPPAPPSPPPTQLRPRANWPPPGAPHTLDTASHVALHLSERRRQPPSTQVLARGAGAARRLTVRLPAAGDALHNQWKSPDRSRRNDVASAPNEFLTEFLSAIMQRQYAEALKYCRLILHFEPQNATARSFQPLLQQKLLKHQSPKEELSADQKISFRSRTRKNEHDFIPEESESESYGSDARLAHSRRRSHSRSHSEPSYAAQSSLDLISSTSESGNPPVYSSDPNEFTSGTSAASGSWESNASRSEDGKTKKTSALTYSTDNDIATLGEIPDITESLQRLRAQFACSTK